MANYNLEELILEGKSKVGLAALGFTKEEIENAQANIEKKNPDVNVLPDAGESPSGDGSLESVSIKPFESVISALKADKNFFGDLDDGGITLNFVDTGEQSSRVYAFGRGKETADKYMSVMQGKAAGALKRYKNLQKDLAVDLDSESVAPGESKVLYEASKLDPLNAHFRYDAVTKNAVTKALQEDSDYQRKIQGYNEEIDQLDSKIKQNKYIPVSVPSFNDLRTDAFRASETRTAEEQRNADKQRLASLKSERLSYIDKSYRQYREGVLEEAINTVMPNLSDDQINNIENAYKGYGYRIDINKDETTGGNKVDIDNTAKITALRAEGLVESVLIYPLLRLNEGLFGPVDRSVMPEWADQRNLTVDQMQRESLSERNLKVQELQGDKTVYKQPFREDMMYGEMKLSKALQYAGETGRMAVESSPYSMATLAFAAATKNPQLTALFASYLAGAEQWAEFKSDATFDSFTTVDGKPVQDVDLMRDIHAYYKSGGYEIKEDQQGRQYLMVPRASENSFVGVLPNPEAKVYVEVNDGERFGMSFANGIAEGLPTAIAQSYMLKAVGLWGSGQTQPLINFWQGFIKAGVGGVGAEGAEEAATEMMTIMNEAAIRGEYISPIEAVVRTTEATLAGMFSGGGMSTTLYTGRMAAMGESGRRLEFSRGQMLNAILSGKTFDIVSEDVEKLRDKANKLASGEVTGRDAEIIEAEIREALAVNASKNEQVSQLLSDLANVDVNQAVELAEAVSNLSMLSKGVENTMGSLTEDAAKAVLSEQLTRAREQVNQGLAKAEATLASAEETQGIVSEAVTEGVASEEMALVDQLTEQLQVTAESLADNLDMSVEQAQELLDNPLTTPTTVAVASRLAGKKGNIQLYESPEAYLKATEDLSGRIGTFAQYDPKTNTVHLSPSARAVDVMEELWHDSIEKNGVSSEAIDEMYDELSKSQDPRVRAIIEERTREYGDSKDMKEEAVVGVLREGISVETNNQEFLNASEKFSSEYKVEKFVSEASAVALDQQRYDVVLTQMAQAGVNELQSRYSEEELNRIQEETGIDISQSPTFSQVEQLIEYAAATNPIIVEPLNSLIPRELMTPEFESAIFSNPQVRKDYEDGKAILTVTVRQDGTGVNEFKLRGRSSGSVMFSGIEGEQLMAEILQGQEGVFALSDKGVVSTLLNKLYGPRGVKRKLEKVPNHKKKGTEVSDYIVINVEQMGPDAIQSGSIISMRRAEGMLEVLEDENTSQRKKNQVVKLVTEWLSDIEISTTRTDVITEVSGRGSRKTGTEQFPRREDAREKRRAAKQEVRELAEQVVEGPISPAAERKAARQTAYTEESFGGTVFFVPNQQVWKSFDQAYLRELYVLRNGNAQQKQEAAEKLLDYLANKNGLETGVTITFENRGKLLGKLEKKIPQGLLVPIEEIKKEARSESLKKFNPEEIKGKIIGTIVGKRKGTTATEFSAPAVKRTEAERESDYGYGIPLEDVSVHTFESPVSIEELTGESLGARDKQTRVNIPKPIVDWIGNEAVADQTDHIQRGKSSRFMGMPDSPFTMTYTEEVVNSKGTYSNNIYREKRFQDGWHFWNWWVLQTGNGKVDKLGGWGYIDENGAFRRLGNIPKKKDRQTGEILEVEPLFRSNQQRQIDSNAEEAYNKMIRREAQEAENKRIEEELREKTKDSNISYELLSGVSGLEYDNLYGSFNTFAIGKYLQSMSNLFDVMTQANALEEGGKIEFSPLSRPSASYQMIAEGQFEGMIDAELASMDVVTRFGREDILQTGKLVTFFRNYARFQDPNIVYSAEKTSDGWKLSVNLKVSDANQKMVDDYNAMDRPQSRQDIDYVIQSFNTGKPYQPKSSKIMPPRYYDLKNDRGAFKGTIDFLNTWMVDKYAEILGLQEQVEEKRGKKVPQSQNFKEIEQLMYGRTRNAMEQLDNKMQAAKEFMVANDITHTDLSQYMYARHAAERNEHIAKKRPDLLDGSGMSNEVAEDILAKFDTKEMKEAAAMFDAILDDTRQTMKDFGLETQERLDAWNELYQNYVPLQGFADDEMDAASNPYPTGGAGMAVYGSKVKAAIGRESEAANVLANIVMQNAVTHQWAEKNRVLESLHDLVKKNPMEDVWSIVDAKIPLTKLDENGRQVAMTIMEMQADPHTVPVRINGEQKFIRFQDPYYADVLNGMTMEQTNTFLRMMRAPVSWLRGVFTQWDPNFFVSNFARDIGGSLYTASSDLETGVIDNVNTKGFQKKMFGNTFRSLNALLGEAVRGKELPAELQQFYDEWKEDGGQTGWNYVKDLKEIEAELAVNADDLTRGKQLRDKLFSSPKKFFEFVEGVNDAFENSIRLSAYMTARQQGASRQQAAVFSKNITVNFNKQGEAGPAINTMYLFFNAAIQGNKRVYESITRVKPPKKADGTTREWYERATGAQKIAAGMAGFSGMLTLLNLAMSGRDPEDDELWYNKVSEYDKQRNMIICYGPERDDFLKIPLPYGFGLFNNMGLALAETSTGNRSTDKALMFLGTSAFSAFSPISFGGDADNPGTFVLRSFAPTTLKPFVELAENRTYFGSPITGEQLPFGTPVPSSELSFRAPQEIQSFFEWMNQATGGSQFKSGWADFNPDYTWYLFEYFVGGSGDFILSTGEQARNLAEMSKRSLEKAKESKDVGELVKALGYGFSEEGEVKINYNDIPIAKKIYGEASPFYDIEAFKDNSMEVEQLFREIKEDKIIAEPGRYKGVQELHKEYQQANKTLKVLRQSLREARDIEDYIDRQNRIFDLYEAQRRVMARYNKKYKQLRGQN